jgi:dsDNA-specific endonuclease/ATPase MutS2
MLLEKQKEIKSELESIKGVARSASILKNSATTYYQTLTKEEKDMVNRALRELNMKI